MFSTKKIFRILTRAPGHCYQKPIASCQALLTPTKTTPNQVGNVARLITAKYTDAVVKANYLTYQQISQLNTEQCIALTALLNPPSDYPNPLYLLKKSLFNIEAFLKCDANTRDAYSHYLNNPNYESARLSLNAFKQLQPITRNVISTGIRYPWTNWLSISQFDTLPLYTQLSLQRHFSADSGLCIFTTWLSMDKFLKYDPPRQALYDDFAINLQEPNTTQVIVKLQQAIGAMKRLSPGQLDALPIEEAQALLWDSAANLYAAKSAWRPR